MVAIVVLTVAILPMAGIFDAAVRTTGTGGDYDAARSGVAQTLEEARALNPASPEVHFNLARAYKRANRPEAADQERLTFARLNELSQAEKNGDAGQQTYTGPRQTDALTSTPTQAKPR